MFGIHPLLTSQLTHYRAAISVARGGKDPCPKIPRIGFIPIRLAFDPPGFDSRHSDTMIFLAATKPWVPA